MATEVGETPLRVLPYDVAIAPRAGIGNVLKRRQEPSPSSSMSSQPVAIDVHASTDEELQTSVEAVRDALFHQFRIPTRTSRELDREALLHQSA